MSALRRHGARPENDAQNLRAAFDRAWLQASRDSQENETAQREGLLWKVRSLLRYVEKNGQDSSWLDDYREGAMNLDTDLS